MKIEALLVLSFLLGASTCHGQTSVVSVRNSSEIAVAADSLLTKRDGTTTTGCKIIVLNSKEVFSFAGVAEFDARNRLRPKGIAYNLGEIAKQSAADGGTIKHIELKFRTRAIPLFKEAFSQARDSSIPEDAEFSGGIETMFASVAGKRPTVLKTSYTFKWNADRSPSITPKLEPCPVDTEPDSVRCVTMLGEREAIIARMEHPTESDMSDIERLAVELVRLEIDKVPQYVGPPVSELKMTPLGVRWVHRGQCLSSTVQK